MIKIIYPIVHAFFYVLSLLPFWALYALADSCYVVVCHLVRYRRKVVRSNLASSFPEMSADELKDIPLSQEAESLGSLAKAQAIGDLLTLSERGRRCVHVHLPDNSGVTLRALSQLIQQIFAEKACVR